MRKILSNSRIRDISVLFICAVIIWLIYFYSNFQGLWAPDAMNYASVARNILEGNGFETDVIIPKFLAYSRENPFAYIVGGSLWPLVLSFFFLIFGVNDNAVALSSGIFFILSVPLIYLLAKELFNRKIAVISALIFTIELNMLYYSVSGLTESLYIFLLLFSFFLFIKARIGWHFLLLGIVLGLSRMVRMNTTFFILPFLLFAYFSLEQKKNIKNPIFLMIGFLFGCFPDLYKEYRIYGDPILGYYGAAAAWGMPHFDLREIKQNSFITSIDYLVKYPKELLNKYLKNILEYYEGLLKITKPLIMSFFVVSLFKWDKDSKIHKIKGLFLLCFLFQLLILGAYAGDAQIRYFHIFIPFIIIFSVDSFFLVYSNFLKIKDIFKETLIIVTILILLAPTVYFIISREHFSQDGSDPLILRTKIQMLTNSNDIIVGDDCVRVAWYADRKTLPLPKTKKMFEQVNSYLPIKRLLVVQWITKDSKEKEMTNRDKGTEYKWNIEDQLYNLKQKAIFQIGDRKYIYYEVEN